jgi:hypothetical protein
VPRKGSGRGNERKLEKDTKSQLLWATIIYDIFQNNYKSIEVSNMQK